ncbi:MAG: DUF4054 domain-containing protein [Myxococcota bacterium]
MSTEARVTFYAPILSGDARIPEALSIAASQLSADPAAWGTQLGDAIALLAAHILITSPLSGDGSAQGPVVSEKSGGESVTYGKMNLSGASLTDQDLARTGPGLQLLRIRDSRGSLSMGIIC